MCDDVSVTSKIIGVTIDISVACGAVLMLGLFLNMLLVKLACRGTS